VSALAWVAFVVAGAVGAMLRYVVDTAVQSRVRGPFPWGTFVVNISGSFVLGVVTGLALYHAFPEEPRIVLAAGFCGAYTTFSTFTFETVRLLEQDAVAAACLNALGTLVTGAGAAALGLALASL
jgi:fluoride exporter